MHTFYHNFSRFLSITAISFFALLGAAALAAWSNPPAGTPPNNCTSGVSGCDGPLTVDSNLDTKLGNLGVPTLFQDELCLGGLCIGSWPEASTIECYLGAAESRSHGVGYTAATDGFILAGGDDLVGTVTVGGVTMKTGEWGGNASIMLPAPAGASWSTSNNYGDYPYVYWIPMTCVDNG